MTIEFLVTSLIVVASPGTGVIYTLAAALSRGSRASVIAALGCTLGIVPHIGAAIVGASALLQASEVAFDALKIAGVVYLLYLAWTSLREHGALRVEPDERSRSAREVIVTAVLINLLNPKLSIFFLAFLPQFVSATEPDPLAHMLGLSVVFMLMTLAVFVAYGLAAAAVRERLLARPRAMAWMRRTFAGAFVLLAARLAVAER